MQTRSLHPSEPSCARACRAVLCHAKARDPAGAGIKGAALVKAARGNVVRPDGAALVGEALPLTAQQPRDTRGI